MSRYTKRVSLPEFLAIFRPLKQLEARTQQEEDIEHIAVLCSAKTDNAANTAGTNAGVADDEQASSSRVLPTSEIFSAETITRRVEAIRRSN